MTAPRQLPPHLDPRASRAPRTAGPGTRLAAQLTRVIAAVAAVALLATGGWGWYLGRMADSTVNRIDVMGDSGTTKAGSAMNLLLVGTDSRDDLTAAQRKELHTGGDAGLNTDTMILAHVPADGSKASFVSFPRDSYVDIPGHGKNKLNSAFSYGYDDAPSGSSDDAKEAAGAQLLITTISELSGLQIDHYAEVDLLGFFNLTEVVGGVEVNLCQAVDDSEYSGAVFNAGKQTISGADALKFVRQRHNIGLTSNDFDRMRRQQVFMAGIVRKIVSEDVLLNPVKQQQLVKAVAKSVTVDQSLNLLDLAQQMQNISPGDVQFQTVPYLTETTVSGVGSVVQLKDEATLHSFFADLSDDGAAAATSTAPSSTTGMTVAPSDVQVEVDNGSGTAGLAGEAASALEAKGFVVTDTGNADASNYTTTSIRYAEGDEALAKALAKVVPGATKTQADEATSGTVELVLGSDFNGVGKKVTTTTAASATTAAVTGEDQRTADDTSCIY